MHIPLLITSARLIVSPVVPAVLLVCLLPNASLLMHVMLAIVFAGMAFTDFFDGYLARRLKQETILGKVLDPIADKMLVLSTSIVLVYLGKMYWFWAVIIMAREVLVMGLRELALMHHFSLPVSRVGKYKSAVQYLYLLFVIVIPRLGYAEYLLGACVSIITIISGYMYVCDFLHSYKKNAQK